MRTYHITMTNGEKFKIAADPIPLIEARLGTPFPFLDAHDMDGRRIFLNYAQIASIVERDPATAAGADPNDRGPIEAILQAVTPILDR